MKGFERRTPVATMSPPYLISKSCSSELIRKRSPESNGAVGHSSSTTAPSLDFIRSRWALIGGHLQESQSATLDLTIFKIERICKSFFAITSWSEAHPSFLSFSGQTSRALVM